ncbi:hypothetical protein BHE74_00038302 [Ensete ventricosum]|uniref:Uncharacterized protein n=1 Tax=Ensete ventricosum TaxID=4639 RepID=A0A427A9U0_ENSVE|nr:hypothetical protein B296_00014661 [Ensete ventricosum]RWW14770.1 hypothetical protein GW17_00021438 [Ensete ventricosum]RWW55077.1 hypothetical protein BHE74_00038302 [Ensete ventricosum]RZR86241.1 hypothetical protein BHM03_00013406 [Ensete ventricosum]
MHSDSSSFGLVLVQFLLQLRLVSSFGESGSYFIHHLVNLNSFPCFKSICSEQIRYIFFP